jgi:hypothetical protein
VSVEVAQHIPRLSVPGIFPLWDEIKSSVVSLLNNNVPQEDIRTQLPLFGVIGGNPLVASIMGGESSKNCCTKRGKEREDDKNRRNVIVPIAALFAGLAMSGLGFWQLLAPSGDKLGFWLIGFVALFVASALIIGGGIWFGLNVGPFSLSHQSPLR